MEVDGETVGNRRHGDDTAPMFVLVWFDNGIPQSVGPFDDLADASELLAGPLVSYEVWIVGVENPVWFLFDRLAFIATLQDTFSLAAFNHITRED